MYIRRTYVNIDPIPFSLRNLDNLAVKSYNLIKLPFVISKKEKKHFKHKADENVFSAF